MPIKSKKMRLKRNKSKRVKSRAAKRVKSKRTKRVKSKRLRGGSFPQGVIPCTTRGPGGEKYNGTCETSLENCNLMFSSSYHDTCKNRKYNTQVDEKKHCCVHL